MPHAFTGIGSYAVVCISCSVIKWVVALASCWTVFNFSECFHQEVCCWNEKKWLCVETRPESCGKLQGRSERYYSCDSEALPYRSYYILGNDFHDHPFIVDVYFSEDPLGKTRAVTLPDCSNLKYSKPYKHSIRLQ